MSTNKSLKNFCENSDNDVNDIEVAVRGYHFQIRKQNKQAVVIQIRDEISKVARLYDVETMSAEMLGACVRKMMNKFNKIGVNEIEHAFFKYSQKENSKRFFKGLTLIDFSKVVGEYEQKTRFDYF